MPNPDLHFFISLHCVVFNYVRMQLHLIPEFVNFSHLVFHAIQACWDDVIAWRKWLPTFRRIKMPPSSGMIGLLDAWKRWRCDPLWHGVTCRKTLVFSTTAVRTTNRYKITSVFGGKIRKFRSVEVNSAALVIRLSLACS